MKNNSFQKGELPERDVWTQNKGQKNKHHKNFQRSVTSHFLALHLIYQLKEEFSAVSTLNIFAPVTNFILGQCYVKNQVTECQIITCTVSWYWKIIYSLLLTEVMGYEEDGAMGSGLNSSYLKNNFCWAALTPVCTAMSSWNFANLLLKDSAVNNTVGNVPRLKLRVGKVRPNLKAIQTCTYLWDLELPRVSWRRMPQEGFPGTVHCLYLQEILHREKRSLPWNIHWLINRISKYIMKRRKREKRETVTIAKIAFE